MYNGQLQGYLYVILGGQAYDSTIEMLQSSYILRLWLVAVALCAFIAMIAGVLVFRLITWRVRRLANSIDNFRKSDFKEPIKIDWYPDGRSGDDIDNLGTVFQGMSERIIQQVNQLEHQDSARRELIANVSHDLRTPLASLQGYLEVLSSKADKLDETDRKKYVDIALRQSERLHKLISELFELSTLENQGPALEFEPFSMTELIQDVTQKYRLDAGAKQLVLNSCIPNEPAFVSADIGMIQRVLENLIENAIKYTPAGGEIDISLLRSEDYIATCIDDSGQGISSEDLPHIFKRFYRVDKHRGKDGTGLGLAIAKRILQLHNSSINVASRPDVGTRFSFRLPSADLKAL
jgi:signal transduction histidine kinase